METSVHQFAVVLQEWHEFGSLLQREGSLPPVFASLREQPTMDRPLQVSLSLLLSLTQALIVTVVLTFVPTLNINPLTLQL